MPRKVILLECRGCEGCFGVEESGELRYKGVSLKRGLTCANKYFLGQLYPF
jgi:hypothetical protein